MECWWGEDWMTRPARLVLIMRREDFSRLSSPFLDGKIWLHYRHANRSTLVPSWLFNSLPFGMTFPFLFASKNLLLTPSLPRPRPADHLHHPLPPSNVSLEIVFVIKIWISNNFSRCPRPITFLMKRQNLNIFCLSAVWGRARGPCACA